MGTFSTLTFNLLILVVFVAVVFVALRVAQSIFGTSTKKAAATEVAAKLVSYPTGSAAVLRRRFVRALTGQHVIMPSGERLAFGELTVRVAPEDLERLDPDGDLERLGEDGAAALPRPRRAGRLGAAGRRHGHRRGRPRPAVGLDPAGPWQRPGRAGPPA